MSVRYFRDYYRMNAHRGQRVYVNGKPGVIRSFPGQYISVKLDDQRRVVHTHPLWRVDYEVDKPRGLWNCACEMSSRFDGVECDCPCHSDLDLPNIATYSDNDA